MPSSLRIIVTQGHRNTSGGNPAEQARTPAIANAITAALARAGHDAICLQNDDGSTDNWFNGSLDAVARRVMRYHAERAVDLLLDVHLESNPANIRGVFTIVPDGTGLKSLTALAGTDKAHPVSPGYLLARSIAREVARCTGLPLRTRSVLEPGVMSEQQTRVGGDLGWRLAMFGYTAPARDRMTRIILECGNLETDAAIIDRPDFAQKVAEGVVAAIGSVPLLLETPVFPPFGTSADLAQPRRVRITVPSLRVRTFAELDQETVATLATGSEFPVSGWVIGENVDGNPVWWLAGASEPGRSRWRMWSGGTEIAGAGVLALPTRQPVAATS